MIVAATDARAIEMRSRAREREAKARERMLELEREREAKLASFKLPPTRSTLSGARAVGFGRSSRTTGSMFAVFDKQRELGEPGPDQYEEEMGRRHVSKYPSTPAPSFGSGRRFDDPSLRACATSRRALCAACTVHPRGVAQTLRRAPCAAYTAGSCGLTPRLPHRALAHRNRRGPARPAGVSVRWRDGLSAALGPAQ